MMFHAKRDAEDWARGTEDEMVRGVYINRAGAEKLLLEKALVRYLAEVSASMHASVLCGEPSGQGAEEEVRRRPHKAFCNRSPLEFAAELAT